VSTELRKISDIIIGDRCRQDLGDIAALAKSMRDLGLLQPVVITQDNKLVAGRRRLAAALELDWTVVPVHVATGLDDALRMLRAERDENACRKDFLPTEAVALADQLDEWHRAEAKKRQQEGGKKAGRGCPAKSEETGSGNFPEPVSAQVRDTLADAVGAFSGRTLEKARAVDRAAKAEPEKYGPLAEQMDATKKVDGAFKKLRTMQAAEEIAKRSGRTAHAVSAKRRKLGIPNPCDRRRPESRK
jgi:ParB family chromosome partitioning protein